MSLRTSSPFARRARWALGPPPGLVATVLAVAAVAFAAACGADDGASEPVPDPTQPSTPSTDPGDPTAELAGRTFLSDQVDGYEPVDGTQITLAFDGDGDDGGGGNLRAEAGCNILSGEYSIVDGRLQTPGLASTEMGCDPDRMSQDRWLTDVLSLEPYVELDGDTLTLRGAGDVTLVLVDRTVADPDRPLTDTRWVLDGIRTGDAVSSVPAGVEASITVTTEGEDGQVLVEAGCNQGSGRAEITDDTIVFGPIALTRMACEPDAMEVEAAVTAVLDGEVRYRIDAGRLTLDSSDTADPDPAGTDSAGTGADDPSHDGPEEMGGTGLLFVADEP